MLVTHEYGHHVADNRDNAPWQAVDYGTKRWATYVGVCRRAKSGELAPGDESSRYTFNPGEALAEDYRRAERAPPRPPGDVLGVVDDSLYPDQTALDLLALDVTSPWTGNTTSSYAGSFTTRSSGRGFTVATPLDGTLRGHAYLAANRPAHAPARRSGHARGARHLDGHGAGEAVSSRRCAASGRCRCRSSG